VTSGLPPKGTEGTIVPKHGARCIISGEPIPSAYIRSQGKQDRMGSTLMAIVTQGKHGRNYHSPSTDQRDIAESAKPAWKPIGTLPEKHRSISSQLYGLDEYHKLFTPRQLTALTTFGELVHEARELAMQDALAAGLADDGAPLRENGCGARAFGEAVSLQLAFVIDELADLSSNLCRWEPVAQCPRGMFERQALPMVWDYAEGNP